MEMLDRPISAAPYVQRRIVQWGECDPAGVIYTPRILDFVLEAVDGWLRQVLGADWHKLKTELGMGMPTVHASLDFMSTLKASDELDVEVRVARLGRSSIEFKFTGKVEPEREVFTCTLVTALVDSARFKAISIPPEFRQRIQAYIQACEGMREC